jgi:hypothetical protein
VRASVLKGCRVLEDKFHNADATRLEFSATVTGDSMPGTVELGMFGSAPMFARAPDARADGAEPALPRRRYAP